MRVWALLAVLALLGRVIWWTAIFVVSSALLARTAGGTGTSPRCAHRELHPGCAGLQPWVLLLTPLSIGLLCKAGTRVIVVDVDLYAGLNAAALWLWQG